MDRRFGIVIGINDYDKDPLDFCANDARAIGDLLVNKCKFHRDDIFPIISEKGGSIRDISGHLESIMKSIESEIRPGEDSIFFFFAGHGEYHFEQSGLKFHDSLVEIGDIFERINSLQPKYQCFVIDACESGGKVLTRGNRKQDIIDTYIQKSSGILFMYAATEEETAKEFDSIKHGLFTYYFLEAINNDQLYDDEGVLTPNRIQDFIAKQTMKESKFKQTPVIENRTIGYYPLAFNKEKETVKENKRKISVPNKEKSEIENTVTIQNEYFPTVPPEIRYQLFHSMSEKIEDKWNGFIEKIKSDDYKLSFGEENAIFDYDIEEKIASEIVKMSVSKKINGAGDTFNIIKNKIEPISFLGGASIIDALLNKGKPQYEVHHKINWNNHIISKCFLLETEDVRNVTIGFSLVIYQAVYGIGVAKSTFYKKFNGYSISDLKGPFTTITGYKINEKTEQSILSDLEIILSNAILSKDEWNSKQLREIEDFENNSK